MAVDNFTRIKQAVADLIETQNIPAYTERYLEQDQLREQRFSVVYFGEYGEAPDDLEDGSEVSGTLTVELFAMTDAELDSIRAMVRPVLKRFESKLVTSFYPTGGEFVQMESGARPSLILNYSVSFDEV